MLYIVKLIHRYVNDAVVTDTFWADKHQELELIIICQVVVLFDHHTVLVNRYKLTDYTVYNVA